MAKKPVKSGTVKSNKPQAGLKRRKAVKPSAKKRLGLDDPPMLGTCCDVLLSVPTGVTAILWRDAAGTLHALQGPTAPGSDKILHCDQNGPYWANP